MRAIRRKLATGHTIILDGATGTELQRRGAPMDDGAWCAVATASHPDAAARRSTRTISAPAPTSSPPTPSPPPAICSSAPASASARPSCSAWRCGWRARPPHGPGTRLAPGGRGRLALDHAAGGKGDRPARPDDRPRHHPLGANLREAAELQAEAGVDLLLLEMICDLEHGGMALEAARATGLPVWVGLSAKRRGPGPLMSFRDGGPPSPTCPALCGPADRCAGRDAHLAARDRGGACRSCSRMRRCRSWPIPKPATSGSPDWQFAEVEPESTRRRRQGWVDARRARSSAAAAASGRRTSRPWRGPSRALTPMRPTREVADAAATARHVAATTSRESRDAPFCNGRRDGPGHVPARACPRHPGADLHAGRPRRQRLRPRGLLHGRQAGRGQERPTPTPGTVPPGGSPRRPISTSSRPTRPSTRPSSAATAPGR